MIWVLENNGKELRTFATNHSISLEDAIELTGIEVDEDNIFYDDLSLRLATDEEKKSWYED